MQTTHTIYAASASDGKHADEKLFGISYYLNATTAYEVPIIFDIPNDIQSYKLKTINLNVEELSGSTALNTDGDIDYIVPSDSIGTLNKSLILSRTGKIAITGDNTKTITQKQLMIKLSWKYQEPYVYFSGINADVVENRPHIEVEVTTPTIDDFNVNGTSIDSEIICTWTQEDVTSWEVQVIQDNTIISTQTGTTETTCAFEAYSLLSGTTTFKIIARYEDNPIEVTKVVELTKTVPEITSIEPSGILKLFTDPISIEFAGNNITSFVIKAIQNGITKFTYSGTTERNVTIINNIFSSGTVKLEIVAKYICAAYETTTTRSETFTAYGPPPTPELVIDETYHTPFPLIKWSSSEQLSYQLKIGSLDTGEVYSNDKMYQVNESVDNHTYYQVSLRVKNQYNLWSEWIFKTLYIDFAELEQPVLNAYADRDKACIVLNIQSEENANFNYHELYRREMSGTWVKIATDIARVDEYHDYTCASKKLYDYKVRAITTEGGYTDSKINTMKCDFKGIILSVPFTETSFNVRYSKEESGIKKSTSLAVDRKFVVYCGCEKPKETRGLTRYRQFSLTTTFKTLEEYLEFEKLSNERVLLFRDNKGTKAYCSMAITEITDDKVFYATVGLSLTEVYYKEGDYSEAESRPLRFVDEEW